MATRRAQIGATLIELLISVLIMGIGLLGVVAGQAVSLRGGHDAMQRSQAVVMSYAIFDAMRSNHGAAVKGAYHYAPGGECNPPAGSGRAQADLIAWAADLKKAVSEDACGEVVCEQAVCTVTVRWRDDRTATDPIEQRVVTRGRI
jgi:type IV pilus assembly protein PilV